MVSIIISLIYFYILDEWEQRKDSKQYYCHFRRKAQGEIIFCLSSSLQKLERISYVGAQSKPHPKTL